FFIFFFFFSSRRRHTRCLSDWSSDECSSDLTLRCDHVICQLRTELLRVAVSLVIGEVLHRQLRLAYFALVSFIALILRLRRQRRSEERRVGKEGRAGWGREPERGRV